MDLPILKYIDILIGLAVVMILVSTVVTAVCQVVLQSSYARARALRGGLQELIANLHIDLAGPAQYIAERVVRHPLLGRPNWLFGWAGEIRNGLRAELKDRLPLPPVNPGSVILREEFIVILLEWAAGEDPLVTQDEQIRTGPQQMIGKTKVHGLLDAVREQLQNALRDTGIPDPKATLADIRRLTLENERAHPELSAVRWRNDAILTVAASEAVAKIHGWFDTMGQRVTQQFAFQARIWTSVIALVVCLTIQIDSFGLLKRLSVDNKFRDSLVTEAKQLQKQREDADAEAEKQKAAGNKAAEAKKQDESEQASDQLRGIEQTLAQLREPKFAIIPSYLAWERVQIAEVPATFAWPDSPLLLSVGASTYQVRDPITRSNNDLVELREALVKSSAPVDIYSRGTSLTLAARGTESGVIRLEPAVGQPFAESHAHINWLGLWAKAPGIFLSWVLVSLGAPFWYDLLKNLLNLRSLIAQKEEKDRTARQTAPSSNASGATPAPS